MPDFQGKTDEILVVKLTSYILTAFWGASQVSLGGKIPLEVKTAYVADGSDIQLTVKDIEGGTLDSIKGKIFSNTFRTQYALNKPNKTGGMWFEVDMPKHNLKGRGTKVQVFPPVKVDNLNWMDAEGKNPVTEIDLGDRVTLKADVTAGPINGKGHASFFAIEPDTGKKSHAFDIAIDIQDKKITLIWEAKYKPNHETKKLKFSYSITVLGCESKSSEEITYYIRSDFNLSV